MKHVPLPSFALRSPAVILAALIKAGHLIPIQVFGAEDGYGLSDCFSEHAPGGSDCNSARGRMFRLSSDLRDDPMVMEALRSVLEYPYSDGPDEWSRRD